MAEGRDLPSVPAARGLAGRLIGETEEDLLAEAKKLAELGVPAPPSPFATKPGAVELIEALHGPLGASEEEERVVQDFDGGATGREPVPLPSDPVADHNQLVLDYLAEIRSI